MMVPQPTAQYGQVERVSVARAISACAVVRRRAAGRIQTRPPPRHQRLCISGSRDVKDSSGDLDRKERRLTSRGIIFIERRGETVKLQFCLEEKATPGNGRCQPADAEVCVRGNSVSVAALAAR